MDNFEEMFADIQYLEEKTGRKLQVRRVGFG